MQSIEQAVFTSAETDRSAGYQVVAASEGIGREDLGELAGWGPSHGALVEPVAARAASLNFHPLPSGAYSISRTTAAGREYSGRGTRIYTQCLVVPPEVLRRFANNPFALMRAASATGALGVYDEIPRRLEPLRLVGGTAPVDLSLLARLASNPGPDWMAALVAAALDAEKETGLMPCQSWSDTLGAMGGLSALAQDRDRRTARGAPQCSRDGAPAGTLTNTKGTVPFSLPGKLGPSASPFPQVVLCGTHAAEPLIAGLINCLPPECRTEFSFSTGLKFSSRRPFRVIAIGGDGEEERRIRRLYCATLLDFSGNPPREPALTDGWARFIHRVLKSGRTSLLASYLAKRPENVNLEELPALGMQFLEEMDFVSSPLEEIQAPPPA